MMQPAPVSPPATTDRRPLRGKTPPQQRMRRFPRGIHRMADNEQTHPKCPQLLARSQGPSLTPPAWR